MTSSHKFKLTRLERRLGRYELMSWINSFLRIDYTKVEEFSDGIAYCQVLDAMIPDCVPLHKLVFHPRNKQDKMRNLKILDRVLAQQNLNKSLDVPALASANFQENNEMLQWCYAMIQRNCPHVVTTYKALERRVAAMKRQKFSSKSVSNSLKTLTNRLIPSEVGMSLLFGSSEREREDKDDTEQAIQDAQTALLRERLEPADMDKSSSQYLPDKFFPKRALHQSFDTVSSENAVEKEELHKIEEVLLEIEENLVLRLKAFDKLREKVTIEHARRDFFYNKLLSLEQLCELMPDSTLSDACRKIIEDK